MIWWCSFISSSVVGTLKKLVGSLKFRRIVMEFSRTKSGGRCSFHFTNSEVFHLCRIFFRQHSIMELLLASNTGSSCWNVKKTICSAEISGILITFSRTKSGGRCWRHFTSCRALAVTGIVLQQNSIPDTMLGFNSRLNCRNV